VSATGKPTNETLLELYTNMVRIRHFEDRVYFLFLEGKMPGTIHLYQGEEAIAIGACAHLSREDVITSTHRPHGHAIAKGVEFRAIMAELFGKTTGCCKGFGGSMHVGDIAAGMIPAIAIVGGGVPLATGCALAFRMQKKKNVAVAFTGDGAMNEGAVHEAMNMGAIWNLPVVYVIENNFYGASTHVTLVTKTKHLAERAAGYGMPGVSIDGNDVLRVYETVGEAIARAREGKGPTLVECLTYRRGGHSRSDANIYRDKKEEKEWLARDPIRIFAEKLKKEGMLTDKKVEEIEKHVEKELDEAVEFAQASPLPKPEDALRNVFAEPEGGGRS
jgi:pyruvate dehydrogenase E1 component alpha subunit